MRLLIMREPRVQSLEWEDPLKKEMGLENPMDTEAWGHKESDTTERLHFY